MNFQSYINNIIEIISGDSLIKSELDKSDFKARFTELSKKLSSVDQAYELAAEIILYLKSSGDLHSKFKRPKSQAELSIQEEEDENRLPVYRRIDNLGYIEITSFDGNDEVEIYKYAKTIHTGIEELSKSGIKGWIVDFRENYGGNMDPMILGLGPLIERNPTAYFKFPDGSKHSWGYENGKYTYNDELIYEISNPVTLNLKLPISILLSERTASSGEIAAVSLFSDSTRTFGQTTKNRTTGNAVYKFEDGSKLVLSTSKLVDLNGKDYLTGIIPDVTSKGEECISDAVEWLKSFK